MSKYTPEKILKMLTKDELIQVILKPRSFYRRSNMTNLQYAASVVAEILANKEIEYYDNAVKQDKPEIKNKYDFAKYILEMEKEDAKHERISKTIDELRKIVFGEDMYNLEVYDE